jgi:hypothetical protein
MDKNSQFMTLVNILNALNNVEIRSSSARTMSECIGALQQVISEMQKEVQPAEGEAAPVVEQG